MRAPAILATADEAIAAIPSGATVAVSGFVGAGHAEMLTSALERRFLQTGTPNDLTLYYCAGQGDRAERGLNHLAHRGLLKRIVGGHWNLAPKLGALALANEVEAYNLPQGVLSVLTREIAAKRPGLFTQVGLNTFIDPINGGGMLNARTTEPLVERIELDGQIWLRYKPMPIHVALIRATYADPRGNLSMDREGLISEVLPMAQAAKNHGGIVIAQVEKIVDHLPDPKSVRVPGLLVDYIVTSGGQQHDQTFGEAFNEDFVVTSDGTFNLPPMPESERKRIGARALREVRNGDIVNLGIGLPEAVAMVAAETGRLSEFTLTVESGPTGGVPASGVSAVALNIAASDPSTTTYITAWPNGETRPNTSNLNAKAGVALNNLAYLYSEHFNDPARALDLAERAREVLIQRQELQDEAGLHLGGVDPKVGFKRTAHPQHAGQREDVAHVVLHHQHAGQLSHLASRSTVAMGVWRTSSPLTM